MAHVQRKCAKCRRRVPDGKRTCPGCGSRDAAYIARWLDPDRVEKSRAFARKVDAEQWVVNMEARKIDGSYVDPAKGRRHVAEVVETWYAAAATSLKPKTRASYRGLIDVRIVPYIGSRQVASLKPSDVQHWVNELTAAVQPRASARPISCSARPSTRQWGMGLSPETRPDAPA